MAYVWTPELTARLINSVLDQVIRRGASYEGNFKKAVWNRIVALFNYGLSRSVMRDRKQLQSKMNDMKKKYKAFSAMKNNSGFGWDPTTDMPTAPEAVWKDIIAVHPQAKEFRTKPLFMFQELDRILSRTSATGSFATYSDQSAAVRVASSAPSSLSDLSSDSEEEVEHVTASSTTTAAATSTPTTTTTPPRTRRYRAFDGRDADTDDGEQDRHVSRRVQHDNDSETRTPAKKQKTTGEKMSNSLKLMAESFASSVEGRSNRRRVLRCADEAIEAFREIFTCKVAVAERVQFIKLLASDAQAATMFRGMDDESRHYMVERFLQRERGDGSDGSN